jgi:hypothetical protein
MPKHDWHQSSKTTVNKVNITSSSCDYKQATRNESAIYLAKDKVGIQKWPRKRIEQDYAYASHKVSRKLQPQTLVSIRDSYTSKPPDNIGENTFFSEVDGGSRKQIRKHFNPM